jgi:polyphosphate kinase
MPPAGQKERVVTELSESVPVEIVVEPPRAAIDLSSDARYINRELSWLAFNERVLDEAENPNHPLLERLRFLSISASNLDEFFMVRVAGLKAQVEAGVVTRSQEGRTPAEQLEAVNKRAGELVQKQQHRWRMLRNELREEGIAVIEPDELTAREQEWLGEHFAENIFPVLTPLAVDPAHPFPFIPNLGFAMVLELLRPEDNKALQGLVPLPGAIDRFTRLPGRKVRFIAIESIVGIFLDRLFPGFDVLGRGLFRVIRDSEVEIEEEAEDLVRLFESALKRRRRGSVIHLTMNEGIPEDLARFVIERFHVAQDDSYALDGLLGLAATSALIVSERHELVFPPYTPRFPERIRDFGGDCFAAIRSKDLIVHHP